MATFAAHVLKGPLPEYGFLHRKLNISSWEMTVERECSEVLMEEQTLSIEHRYKQITSHASAFLGQYRLAWHAVLFVPGMKANLVSPGQLTDKGANLQTEGVTRIIASGGQVAATVRYRHRLLCLDLKLWPASNSTTVAVASNGKVAASACNGMIAGAACNGMMAAAACTGTTAGAACNGKVAAAACNGTAAEAACNGTVAAVTCNGMTKAIDDGSASLKTYAVGSKATPNLWHARLGHVHFDAVKRTATSGGVLGMDLEKGGEDMP
ncbi:unnamed protein product [Closterium sp. Naga37s-1]|nr:unnamed protein product [Closterium sp. Naga37s-1]